MTHDRFLREMLPAPNLLRHDILNQKAKASIKHDALPIKSGGVASHENYAVSHRRTGILRYVS